MKQSNNIISNNDIETRVCITCHKSLPIDSFGKRRSRSSKPDAHWIYSRYGECLDCTSKRHKLWRDNNPKYMTQWYEKQKQLKI
jgi:hypothetical protein